MRVRFSILLLVGALANGCGHGATPAPGPSPAAAPASGPAAVAPVSPADVRHPAAAPAPRAQSLYDRLGGGAAVAAVVDTFTAKVHGDPALAPLFRGVDMDNFKRLLRELVCQAAGGPCTYSGRSMRAAHEGLGITDDQFNTVVGYMSQTLDQFNVPEREKRELLALLAPMRPDIVGH